jgi:ribose 5-phosphate isomerase A
MTPTLSLDQIKERLGEDAAQRVSSGMRVGLGSGSTAHRFIRHLAERCRQEDLHIVCVASSQSSYALAHGLGLSMSDIDAVDGLDLTVDGADEVDPQYRLIKGAGGAHVREKIVAAMSKELLILVDHNKLVERLGRRGLPVEVLRFGHLSTQKQLERIGYCGEFRQNGDGLYLTDNGNYILDLAFQTCPDSPEACDSEIRAVPGVVDTGFFLRLVSSLLVGFCDGQVVEKSAIVYTPRI